MAVKDVKQYYYTMLNQYLEMKANLADFEQGLADGYITEDQLIAAQEEIYALESNYERLSYIMYLLEMPNRSSKKEGYNQRNKILMEHFTENNATDSQVELENRSALDKLRIELKKLKEVGN